MSNEKPSSRALAIFAEHGGNLAAARALFPDAPLPWIDLSTGVNPNAYPVPLIEPSAWARLPEPAALAALEAAAAARYGVADAACVVSGPGTQAIIQSLARIFPARRVGVLGFSYGGHASAWRAAGANVERIDRLETLAKCEVAIVVNPNNPDGRVVCRAALEELRAKVKLLVVDEAFVDFEPAESSLAGAASRSPQSGESLGEGRRGVARPAESRAIVLRSFGKAYGLAGLRLGFAICPPDLAASLRRGLGDWPVSGPAIAIGRQALADEAWLRAAAVRAAQDAARLERLLAEAGFAILGGTALFRLASHAKAADVFRRLLSQGILARPFATRPNALRFGLPADAAQWARLASGLVAAP